VALPLSHPTWVSYRNFGVSARCHLSSLARLGTPFLFVEISEQTCLTVDKKTGEVLNATPNYWLHTESNSPVAIDRTVLLAILPLVRKFGQPGISALSSHVRSPSLKTYDSRRHQLSQLIGVSNLRLDIIAPHFPESRLGMMLLTLVLQW